MIFKKLSFSVLVVNSLLAILLCVAGLGQAKACELSSMSYTLGEKAGEYTANFPCINWSHHGTKKGWESWHYFYEKTNLTTGVGGRVKSMGNLVSGTKYAFVDEPGSRILLRAWNIVQCDSGSSRCPDQQPAYTIEFQLPDGDTPPEITSFSLTPDVDVSVFHRNVNFTSTITALDDKGVTSGKFYIQSPDGTQKSYTPSCTTATSYSCSKAFTARSLGLNADGTYQAWWVIKDSKGQEVVSVPLSFYIENFVGSAAIISPSLDINERYKPNPAVDLTIPVEIKVEDQDDPLKELRVNYNSTSTDFATLPTNSGSTFTDTTVTFNYRPFTEHLIDGCPVTGEHELVFYPVYSNGSEGNHAKLLLGIGSITKPPIPVVSELNWDGNSAGTGVNTSGKIKIKYEKVCGAQEYKFSCSGSACGTDGWPLRRPESLDNSVNLILGSGEAEICARAINNIGESDYGTGSACKSVTILRAAPEGVNFEASLTGITNSQSGGSYTLTWQDNLEANHYRLYEKVDVDGDFVEIATDARTQTAIVGKPLGTYYYRIDACADNGNCTQGRIIDVTVVKPLIQSVATDATNRTLVLKGQFFDPEAHLSAGGIMLHSGASYQYAKNQVTRTAEGLVLSSGLNALHNALYDELGVEIVLTNANGQSASINAYGNTSSSLFNGSESPILVGKNGTLYMGVGNQLHAINPQDGTTISGWPYITGGDILARPTQDQLNNNLYIGTTDDKLYAITALGEPKWQTATQGDIISEAVVDYNDSSVYVGSMDRALYAMDRDTGAIRWQYPLSAGVDQAPELWGDGYLYVGTADGQLHMINRNALGPGALVWEGSLDSELAAELKNIQWTPSQDNSVELNRIGRLLYGLSGRSPYREELVYWSYKHIYDGTSLVTIATSYLRSDEGRARYPLPLSATEHLKTLFYSLFSVKTEDEMYAYVINGKDFNQWSMLLGEGMSLEEIAVAWVNSSEYANRVQGAINSTFFYYFNFCLLSEKCVYDGDGDKDGLGDLAEVELGTNPTDRDTDNDGEWDGNDPSPLDSLEKVPQFDYESELIGSLSGSFRVTESGSAAYAIPVVLPPGIAGVVPELGINYNSQQGNGPLGVGWGLSGLSSVQRCRATFETDGLFAPVDLDDEDKLCLDGARLILVDGDNLAEGAEYRTEIDTRAKIILVSEGGQLVFEVKREDGTLWRYGADANSRQQNSDQVFIWMLSSISDSFGNTIEYKYDHSQTARADDIAAASVPLLSEIKYADNRVVFDYSDGRSDASMAYIFGQKWLQDRRLNTIYTYNHNDVGLASYRFSYTEQTRDSRGSRLDSIQLCADDSEARCLLPTEFDYTDIDSTGKANQKESFDLYSHAGEYAHGMNSGDFNGDGISELVMVNTSESDDYFKVNIFQPSMNYKQESTLSFVNGFKVKRYEIEDEDYPIYQLADFDNNGTTDVLYLDTQGQWQLEYFKADNPVISSDTLSLGLSESQMNPQSFNVADFDADGRADLVYPGCGGFCIRYNQAYNKEQGINAFSAEQLLVTERQLLTELKKGYGLTTGQELSLSLDDYKDKPFILDLNGDGQPELLAKFEYSYIYCVDNPNDGELCNDGNTHKRHRKSFWQPVYLLQNQDGSWRPEILDGFNGSSTASAIVGPRNLLWGDINGDGNSDSLRKLGSDGKSHIYYGTGVTGDRGVREELTFSLWDSEYEPYDSQFLIDLNQDGKSDLITTYGGKSLYVFYAGDDGLARSTRHIIAAGFDITKEDMFGFGDYDGDGSLDIYIYDKSEENVVLLRDLNEQNIGTDLLTTITTGAGVKTEIRYEKLNNPDVYQKGAAHLVHDFGKGSAVLDVNNAMPVVAEVKSDAAVDELGNINQLSVNYRYRGLRMQAGGRGSLGFEALITQDPQTDITTVTQYRQDFPYVGMPYMTTQYLGEEGSSVVLSHAENTWDSLVFWQGKVRWPYLKSVSETKYQLNYTRDEEALATTATAVAEVDTLNTYTLPEEGASYANLTGVSVTTVDKFSGDTNTVTTSNMFEQENPANWWIGRVTSSEVTHARSNLSHTIKRKSSFAYDSQTGVLQSTIVEPDGDESLYLQTHYSYDKWGNKTQVTQCSKHFAASCDGSIPSIGWSQGEEYKIFARQTSEYDNQGRYVLRSGDGLKNLVEYSGFDGYGRPIRTTNIIDENHKTYSENYVDGFGKPLFSRSIFGSYTYTQYGWCHQGTDPDITCPTGALSWVQTRGGGKPISIDFLDFAGRKLRTSVQGFEDNSWIYQDTHFDTQGRAKKASEPYYAGDTPIYSESEYDPLGRLIKLTAASGVETYYYVSGNTRTTRRVSDVNESVDLDSTSTINAFGDTTQVVDASGTLKYAHNAIGNLTQVTNVDGSVIKTDFDDYGRRLSLSDPDKGDWTFAVNALGKQVASTAPDGVISTSYRDNLGRVIKRITTQSGRQLDNVTLSYENYKLIREALSNGPYKEFEYDKWGRAVATRHYLPGLPESVTGEQGHLETRQYYDGLGRVYKSKDVSGRSVVNAYNERGYLQTTKDANTGTLYFKVVAMDARGNVTHSEQGTGINTTRGYDAATGFLSGVSTNDGQVQSLGYTFSGLGNLKKREDLAQGVEESFVYDDLNRLTDVEDNANYALSLTYFDNGNIKTKSDLEDGAEYQYGTKAANCSLVAGPHAVTAVGDLSYCYDKRGNQIRSYKNGAKVRELTYGHFDKPVAIWTDKATTQFAYDANRSRYLRTDIKAGGDTSRTWYIGNVELLEKANGDIEYKRYIGNAIHTLRNNGTQDLLFLHKDHQGSVDVITKSNGELVEKLSFDAFGARRQAIGWSPVQQYFTQLSFGSLLDGDFITQRGYTGHEHIDHAQVIHMNGRTYDPVLGRVMQADPFIQAPTNSQSYNRYSYVVNNPLSLTDPSGYLFTKPFKKIFRNVIRASSKIFGAEVTNVLGTIAFSYLGGPLGTAYWTYNFTRAMGGSSSQALKGAFISAASAMIFQQIGQGFNQAYGPFAEATLGQQAAWVGAHALTGGIVSVAQGGKFGHGFLSAGLSKGIMGHFTYADISAPAIMGRTLVAALIGGTVSQVSGGKFANGAATAAIAHLMNAEGEASRQAAIEEEAGLGYPFGKESQSTLDSDYPDELAQLEDKIWSNAVKNRLGGKAAEQMAADQYVLENPGSVVQVGGVTLRVGGKLRYPDLTVLKQDGSYEFIEVKSGNARLIKSQIRIDRAIQTSGAMVTRSSTGLIPIGPIAPTNVDLFRVTWKNLPPIK